MIDKKIKEKIKKTKRYVIYIYYILHMYTHTST